MNGTSRISPRTFVRFLTTNANKVCLSAVSLFTDTQKARKRGDLYPTRRQPPSCGAYILCTFQVGAFTLFAVFSVTRIFLIPLLIKHKKEKLFAQARGKASPQNGIKLRFRVYCQTKCIPEQWFRGAEESSVINPIT